MYKTGLFKRATNYSSKVSLNVLQLFKKENLPDEKTFRFAEIGDDDAAAGFKNTVYFPNGLLLDGIGHVVERETAETDIQ